MMLQVEEKILILRNNRTVTIHSQQIAQADLKGSHSIQIALLWYQKALVHLNHLREVHFLPQTTKDNMTSGFPISNLLLREPSDQECSEGGEDVRKGGGVRKAAPPVSCILRGIQSQGAEQAGQGLGFARFTPHSRQTTDQHHHVSTSDISWLPFLLHITPSELFMCSI